MSMTPYYQRGPVTLWHADCLEILPTLAGSVDAVVSDPPYGIAYNPAGGSGDFGAKTYTEVDKIAGDDKPFDPFPILKLGVPCILWGANHFAQDLPKGGRWLIWDKRVGAKSDSFSDCEVAWCSERGQDRLFQHLWKGGIRASEHGDKFHPSQKPVALLEWCLDFVPSGIVCDPYSGSGTTAIACIRAERQFIGCELEERYCEIAAKRFDKELDQGKLFAEPPTPPPVQKSLIG